MALTFVSSTVSGNTATATAVPVSWPASIAAGDVLVLLVGTKPFSAIVDAASLMLAGWQNLGQATNGSTAQGADTGSVLMAAFAKEANGTETGTLTVNITSGNASFASLYRYTKAAGQAVNFAASFGSDITANTTWSTLMAADPGIVSGDHLVLGGVTATDVASTWSASAFAATGGTFTGIQAAGDNNPRVSTGNQIGGNTNHLSCTAGPVSAAGTWTATLTVGTNETGTSVVVRIREIAPGSLPSGGLNLGVNR